MPEHNSAGLVNFKDCGEALWMPIPGHKLERTITSPNGNVMRWHTNETTFAVSDITTQGRAGWLYGFKAKVDLAGPDTVLSLLIRTRDIEGDIKDRHPDIKPYELLPAALRHFTQTGQSPKYFCGLWVNIANLDTNFQQYLRARTMFGNTPTEAERKLAAAKTWSARLYSSVGFKAITAVNEIEGSTQNRKPNISMVTAKFAPEARLE